MSENTLPYMIYAEITPNPATMKFVANHVLAQQGRVYDFKSEAESAPSPLAERLFSFPFVSGVFIAQNFVSITKMEGVEWDEVMLELREYLSNYLNAGQPLFKESQIAQISEQQNERIEGQIDHKKAETAIEEQIVEILDDYVRPAVEGDGGAIHFKSYENGKLSVLLKGACSGCPSSSVTLKAGIQALFDRMLPEVKEVIAEEE
jgi:Fe-S cluster biogenesis protein NfuA